MKSISYTFVENHRFDADVLERLDREVHAFLLKLTSNSKKIHGVLQSHTFPRFMTQEQCFEFADHLHDLFSKSQLYVLGGDTSNGEILCVTIVALCEED